MNDSLPVSAIVTHYNRSDLIGAAVESIRRQTAQPAETIIVDDASLPEHRDALRKYSPGARVIYLDKHRGPSAARNAGIEAATQDWVAFLDDDDEWLPGKLERQWSILREDEALSAVAGALIVAYDGLAHHTQVSHSPAITTLSAALEGTLASMDTILIRAADIRALRGFDANFVRFEDKEFWIRFTAAGYRGY